MGELGREGGGMEKIFNDYYYHYYNNLFVALTIARGKLSQIKENRRRK